ncbi:DUF421 domain-containing protein [Cohnella zeiphila]|uniref:DUF421 domain-containing protein n=1 Tax=Cohnella zeiphila TaxID=2761120 RepID=A0A7X0SKC3_9BACL|nr:DUF421 domain-containing protein [Cohnella zeiphila]MBB6729348.1 DUF421 domain-containing protein [Cohnella zeiphila]
MEMTPILLRTVLMYLFIYLMLRLMGKREIGKLSVFDMVISIMIAEIAVISIEDTKRSVWTAIVPIAMLALIQLGIARLSLRNRRVRLWFDGTPSVLIRNGELNWREMRKLRYNLDDLMTQLRENKLDDIGEVEWAILESSGKLSVQPKKQGMPPGRAEAPPSPESSGSPDFEAESSAKPEGEEPKFRFELLPIPLIMDGAVQDRNLEQIGKNRFWLKNELRERGIRSFGQVFLCTMDHRGKLYIGRKK